MYRFMNVYLSAIATITVQSVRHIIVIYTMGGNSWYD